MEIPFYLLVLGGIVWCILVAVVILYTIYTFYQHWKYFHIPGPPRGSYLWGNLKQIKRAHDAGKTLHFNILVDWAKQYGKVYKYFSLHRVTVVVLDPQALQDLLGSGIHPKPHTYSELSSLCEERFMGKSLMTEVDNKDWAPRRKFLGTAFQKSCLTSLFNKLQHETDLMVDRLKTSADGVTIVKMFDEFCMFTASFLVKAFCGSEENIYLDAKLVIQAINHGFDHPLDKYNPLKMKYRQEVNEATRRIRQTFRKAIHSRLKGKKDGLELPQDMLSVLLQNGDVDLMPEDIVDEFVSLLMAGFETTASTLSFCLMELCRHPSLLKKLLAELQTVLGNGRKPEISDLDKLEYLEKVVRETLRMYPVALGTMRVLKEDRIYNNLKIPANTTIMVSMVAMARTELFYQKPLKYDPDRFSSLNEVQKGAHCPFSLGPRNCIGKDLTMMIVKLLLAKLLTVFNFQWVKDQSRDILEQTTLKLKDKCQMFVTVKSMSK
ncbi:cholesterol 24-hydroxylase-like isoform X2 [Ptychodera flava]|uniref:cholesterol 24-hydroxylase-like isoform X2 n=1 Tax=Ptychodera flava TaxID=63121 RepID=UPI00396A408C